VERQREREREREKPRDHWVVDFKGPEEGERERSNRIMGLAIRLGC